MRDSDSVVLKYDTGNRFVAPSPFLQRLGEGIGRARNSRVGVIHSCHD